MNNSEPGQLPGTGQMAQHGGDGPSSNSHDISSIVGNMVLAHELIVNDEFQLSSFKDNT